MKNITLNISGMHCASCAANIGIALKRNSAIKSTDVNVTTKKARIEYDESKIDQAKIEKIIVATGYKVLSKDELSSEQEHSHGNASEKKLKMKVIISSILALPLLLRMFWMWEIPGSLFGISFTDWLQHDLTFIVVFFFGFEFHKNAFKSLLRRQTDMDTLISLGTLSAYFYSTYAMFTGGHLYFESAATITALILLGRYLEFKTKDRASLAMKKLLEFAVKEARVIENGQEIMKAVEKVKIGEIILIKPSEKIPLDGVVIEGKSNVDESMLSGESLPVFKTKDAVIYAATINQDSTLTIKVTHDGENTVFKQIIKTVEEAQDYKAPVQRLADKISAIFVPVVVLIALATFVGWYLISGDMGISILNAVAVLVISCPCALGIATPIAIMVGSSVGARQGILIKNGESFERTKKINAILFDKTGTLTTGIPSVEQIIINNDEFKENQILKIASSLSTMSEHPLSKAISAYAKQKQIKAVNISNFKEIPGRGVSGECSEHQVKLLLGNLSLLKENNINIEWAETVINNNKTSGKSINFITHGENIIAAILISDQIKETAHEAIKEIKKLGIKPYMISGDNQHVVATVAQKIGIENYIAEVLPQDKQKEVKKLQERGLRVAFAGDGINDAPALVQAELGIAMASGTDIAKESGEIIIMKNNPLKIVGAIKLSQKTFSIIKQNLFWAFFYNTVTIPLAIFGIVNPMLAALAMGFSDITVIGNSLRIYRKVK